MEKHFCRNILFAVGIFFYSYAFSSHKDSLNLKDFKGFYLNSSYGYSFNRFYYDKYSSQEEQNYNYERADFRFQSPSVGFGYIFSRKFIFFKTGISYCYGTKRILETIQGSSADPNAGVYYYNGLFFNLPDYQVGGTYYSMHNKIDANLTLHYLDLNMDVGINITKKFRLLFGLKGLLTIGDSYSGLLQRSTTKYIITAQTGQYSYKDSVLTVTNTEFKNDAIRNQVNQSFANRFYISNGFNYTFNIYKAIGFVDVKYDINVGYYYITGIRNYVSVKFGYVFAHKKH